MFLSWNFMFYEVSLHTLESELSILHYAQNWKLGDENLGCFDRTSRFSNPEFSILHHTQNRKLREENLAV